MSTGVQTLQPPQPAPLGRLLAQTLDGLLQAQRQLDDDALQRVSDYVGTPAGTLVMPPLWFTLSEVQLQLEFSATLQQGVRAADALQVSLLNPSAVALYGHAASTALRVALRLTPQLQASDAGA